MSPGSVPAGIAIVLWNDPTVRSEYVRPSFSSGRSPGRQSGTNGLQEQAMRPRRSPHHALPLGEARRVSAQGEPNGREL